MAIVNPNIIMQAANIPRVQIRQPESMAESVAAVAPGINAMRQMQVSQAEQQEKMQQRQALEAMRKQNLDPVGIGKWLMTNGRTSQEIQLGFNIYKTATEDESFRQALGGQTAGMPAGGAAMPAQGGAETVATPVAQTARPAMAQPAMGQPAAQAAAQPAVETVGGRTREEYSRLLTHPNKEVRAAAKAALDQFPKPDREFAPTELERLQAAQAQLPAGDPRREQNEARIRILTTRSEPPQTTIKLAPQESAEQKGRGETNVKLYQEISDSARLAARTLPAIETQRMALERGFTTQWGGQAIAAAASLLGALGIPEAKQYATDAQTFAAALNQTVLQRQLEQKGVQTQADADRIQATGAQLGNTVDANKFILDVAKAQAQRDLEQRKFFDDWWRKNKSYEGAEDAWYEGPGGKSLFDRPELRKYAGRGAATAAPTQPATGNLSPAEQQELEALRRRFGRQQ